MIIYSMLFYFLEPNVLTRKHYTEPGAQCRPLFLSSLATVASLDPLEALRAHLPGEKHALPQRWFTFPGSLGAGLGCRNRGVAVRMSF